VRDPAEPRRLLDALAPFGRVLAIKVYRLAIDDPPAVPLLPCLDHEAKLHGGIPPHLAAYLQDAGSGDLHELVFYPSRRCVYIDTTTTWGEYSEASGQRLRQTLAAAFPSYSVRTIRPSAFWGDRRVAESCAAQVPLREVLESRDFGGVQARIERLRTISSLMEKESRVGSWGVRTVTGPTLAVAGLATVYLTSGATRILLVLLLGACFVYLGLKAVQLTSIANRVWKRTAEYGLILQERRRLAEQGRPATLPAPTR
jgi:hypothetical protein